MNSNNIKHKDPFLGEIELTPVGQVTLDAFNNTETYFLIVDEKIQKRGLDGGAYIKNDQTGEFKYLSGKKMEMIAKIYDKLTRLD